GVRTREGGQLIAFGAHQDTVPVDGMTIEPWTPVVRDGRIYGRGACDIKGGMCAMLGAVARLAEEQASVGHVSNVPVARTPRPTVIMACTVNEEHGYTGALALPKLWEDGHVGNMPHGIVPRKPDVAVIAEPTLLNVVVA